MEKTAKTRARRKVIVVDNRPLAQRIGERIRAARQAAGLSQRQLAAGRFTGAYISALEKGIAKPSMASLAYISERLGIPIRHFLDDAKPTWTRLEADVRLASGDWKAALDAYRKLLDDTTDKRARAEILRGTAEALCRLGRGPEAIGPASEAVELFAELKREADEARALYWLGAAHYYRSDMAEARSILRDLLERLRGGLGVEADFRGRVLTALALVESAEGDEERALAHLEEAKNLADEFDDRRRATFLFALSRSYHEAGDLEAAIRLGNQGLALYQAADAESEAAALDNSLAITHLRMGQTDRARQYAVQARAAAERLDDRALLSHVMDTQASIALADKDYAGAMAMTDDAARLAEEINNLPALVSTHVTRARVQLGMDQREEATKSYERAVELLRRHGPKGRLQQVLREWADILSTAGDHARANELYREALTKPA